MQGITFKQKVYWRWNINFKFTNTIAEECNTQYKIEMNYTI